MVLVVAYDIANVKRTVQICLSTLWKVKFVVNVV